LRKKEHFKDSIKTRCIFSLENYAKGRCPFARHLASLEKEEISPSVIAKLNELTLIEVEKILNVLLMLRF
jgi:hypothetical protein